MTLLLLMAWGTMNVSLSSMAEQSKPVNALSSEKQSGESNAPSIPAVGKADGTLTVNGKTVPIRFAYARRIKGRFDATKQEFDLILTDKPLPAVELKSLRELRDSFHTPMTSIRNVKAQGVYLYLDSEGKIRTRAPYHEALDGTSIAEMTSENEGFKIEKESITGKTKHDGEDFGQKWRYSISFHASLKE